MRELPHRRRTKHVDTYSFFGLFVSQLPPEVEN